LRWASLPSAAMEIPATTASGNAEGLPARLNVIED
jgi:hypothetical protein